MYLLSLTNWDYVLITILLGANFITAYLFRRKNSTSEDFIFAQTRVDKILGYIGSVGLIEFILAGIAGAYLGFNAIYYVAVALILQLWGQRVLVKRYLAANVVSLNDYLGITVNRYWAVFIALFNIIFLILCASLVTAIAFKTLQAIMGWGFINNIMGLLGFTIILILIGGKASISYNSLVNILIIVVIFVLGITIALINLGGIGAVINNLHNLAASSNLPAAYYIFPVNNTRLLWVSSAIIIGVAGYRLINFNLRPNIEINKRSFFSRSCIAVILIIPGIIAITTPNNTGKIAGKEIVTIMAQLPDGQTGYVVKAVDGKQTTSSPGILPPILNTKTGLIEPGKYNYGIASIVALRHYLPKNAGFCILLILLAGFMLNISQYMLRLGQITVNNILLPLNLLAKYGKIGEIWSLQVSIVAYTGLILVLAYFMFLHYDLLFFVSLILIFMIMPLLVVIGLILINRLKLI
ncbi:MAG: hypothetical protein KBD37_04700 [Burkholderiales bacterium]|nr:hypothetical protein [Burkholderiales bacterium]